MEAATSNGTREQQQATAAEITRARMDRDQAQRDLDALTKLNAAGTAVLYSTFLGGNSFELALGVAADASGAAYVTGYTYSSNFPVTPGVVQTALQGGADGFVTKLSPSGSTLVYSTYVGGGDEEGSPRIALDAAGGAHVTGSTRSVDFPTTTMAFQANFGGGVCGGGPFPSEACMDSFVTEVNEKGSP